MTIDIEQFIQNNAGLVHSAVNRAGVKKKHPDYEDLVQEGMILLIHYLRKANEEGAQDIEQIKSYAHAMITWRIRRMVLHKVQQKTGELHYSQQQKAEADARPDFEEAFHFQFHWNQLAKELTEEEQDLFYELFALDLSVTQIAEKHDCNRSSIYKRRKKLQEKICL